MRLALLVAFVAACQTPGAKLVYAVANDGEQSCGSTNCADVNVPCQAVISIRILRPSDPNAPLVTICEPLPQNRNKDLCAISSIDLASEPLELPKETLEVQMLVWAREEVEVTPGGALDCAKHDVKFDAVAGFPISQDPAPAIGGHTYYHPGDEEIRVTLGCTHLDSLFTCNAENRLRITSTVQSFENIGVILNDTSLRLDVGEPELVGAASVYSMRSEALIRLTNSMIIGPIVIWEGFADREEDLREFGCTQVIEDVAQATAAVRCTRDGIPVTDPTKESIDLPGYLLPKATLDQVLFALNLLGFPSNGMTVGIVVDASGNPVAGQVVSAGFAVQYLNASRTAVGGSMTSSSGIFVALDAPFPTPFSVPGALPVIGGQIKEKVTVVVIQK